MDFTSAMKATELAANAAGSLGSGLVGMFRGQNWYKRLQEKQAEIQYRYGQMAADADMNRQKRLFDYEAAYNSPAANRRRLEQANLLGASLFEGAAPGTGSIPSVDSGRPSVGLPGMPSDAGLSSISEGALRSAQIRNIDSQSNYLDKKSGSLDFDNALKASQTALNGAFKTESEERQLALSIQNHIQSATTGEQVAAIVANSAAAQKQLELLSKKVNWEDASQRAAITSLYASSFSAYWHAMEAQSMIPVNNQQAQWIYQMTQNAYYEGRTLKMLADAYDSIPGGVRQQLLNEIKRSGIEVAEGELDVALKHLRNQIVNDASGYEQHQFFGMEPLAQKMGLKAIGLMGTVLGLYMFGRGAGSAAGRSGSRPIGFNK